MKTQRKLSFFFAVTLVVVCGFQKLALAQDKTIEVNRQSYQLDPDQDANPFTAGRNKAPRDTSVQACPGDTITFSLYGYDADRKRKSPNDPWENVNPGTGTYRITFTCDANGAFGSADGPQAAPPIDNIQATNVRLYVKNVPVTVTATAEDLAPDPAVGPDSGTAKDANPSSITWTITGRKHEAPTTIAQEEPESWLATTDYRVIYTHPVGPKTDIMYYYQQIVQEEFGQSTALFTMDDIDESWLNMPGNEQFRNNPDAIASRITQGRSTGSFSVDLFNKLIDGVSGFGDTSPFKESSLTGSGVGVSVDQTFISCGNVLGKFTIQNNLKKDQGNFVLQYRKYRSG